MHTLVLLHIVIHELEHWRRLLSLFKLSRLRLPLLLLLLLLLDLLLVIKRLHELVLGGHHWELILHLCRHLPHLLHVHLLREHLGRRGLILEAGERLLLLLLRHH